jgi:hypothetical protein
MDRKLSINEQEKTILTATVMAARQRHGGFGPPDLRCQAREVQAAVPLRGIPMRDVALTLLHLRDHGLVDIPRPTHGHPGDGEFAVCLTPAGLKTAAEILEWARVRL